MPADPLDATLDVNLRVRDLELSVSWYRRIFGVEPLYRGEDRSLDGHATPMACFRLGKVKFWLLPADSRTQQAGVQQRVGLAFMTAQPLATLRRELAARGATFDDTPMARFPIDEDGVRQGKDAEFLYLVDPDGHRLEFSRVFALDGS